MPSSTRRNDSTDPALCTCFRARRAARALSKKYDAALKTVGLKANQFSVLALAARVGPEPLGKLADRLGMDRTTLTRNLGPLAREGLVEVGTGEDRRSRWVGVTARGERRIAEALPLWQEVQRSVVEELGEAEWRRLIAGLARF